MEFENDGNADSGPGSTGVSPVGAGVSPARTFARGTPIGFGLVFSFPRFKEVRGSETPPPTGGTPVLPRPDSWSGRSIIITQRRTRAVPMDIKKAPGFGPGAFANTTYDEILYPAGSELFPMSRRLA